jgi:hypothetical protein
LHSDRGRILVSRATRVAVAPAGELRSAAEGDLVRIAANDEIVTAVARLADVESRLSGYCSEMLAHPIAGRSLRNYCLLTECPEMVGSLGLSADERFWSRYYWLARFAREWQAVAGYDAGLQQQLFQLLEFAEVEYDPLPEVEAAIERDAVLASRKA